MSQNIPTPASSGALPAPTMPERAIPRNANASDDNLRTSEDMERARKIAYRNSYQSTATVVPSIIERPSQEGSDGGLRGTEAAHQQLTAWGMPQQNGGFTESPRMSTDLRPPGPGIYGRQTSNDYTIYDGGAASTPTAGVQAADPYKQNGPYRSVGAADDNYFQQPYRRGTGTGSIRDTMETGSLKNGMNGMNRYSALSTGHAPLLGKKSKEAHWPDGYERDMDDSVEADTPQKRRSPPRPTQRRSTSIYLVREGGDDGNGSPPPGDVLRLPLLSWVKGPVRNHFVAWLGECVGTTLFLFFAFAGTLVANIGAKEAANSTTAETAGFSPIVTLYVAVSFGFSLMVNVWIFFRVSGGLFNPAVTLGMVMTKAISYSRGILLVTAQLTGAILASFLVQILFPFEYNVRTTLSASTSVARGVFIEMILTSELVFTVFMLAKEKHKATYMAPVGIGLALFVAELVGVFFTGGSLNPARSFGPCVTTGKFDSEHWIYWVGPALGAILSVAFYRFIKILEYEMANPGQDHNEEEAADAAERASLGLGKRRSADGEKDLV